MFWNIWDEIETNLLGNIVDSFIKRGKILSNLGGIIIIFIIILALPILWGTWLEDNLR